MSKANYAYKYETATERKTKEKLFHKLRRFETRKKKQDRSKKAKNREYSTWAGYWIDDTKYVSERKVITVPEQKVMVRKLNHYKDIKKVWWNESTLTFETHWLNHCPVYTEVQKTIPEHEKKVVIRRGYIPAQPKLKRIANKQTKYYRKLVQKKVRRSPLEELYQHGLFKKVGEYLYMVWG